MFEKILPAFVRVIGKYYWIECFAGKEFGASGPGRKWRKNPQKLNSVGFNSDLRSQVWSGLDWYPSLEATPGKPFTNPQNFTHRITHLIYLLVSLAFGDPEIQQFSLFGQQFLVWQYEARRLTSSKLRGIIPLKIPFFHVDNFFLFPLTLPLNWKVET